MGSSDVPWWDEPFQDQESVQTVRYTTFMRVTTTQVRRFHFRRSSVLTTFESSSEYSAEVVSWPEAPLGHGGRSGTGRTGQDTRNCVL